MTWFQLVEREEPKTRSADWRPPWLVPNSAFFLNPTILQRPQPEPVPVRPPIRLLRLVR